jgi:DNA-binding response OmpR family regulator
VCLPVELCASGATRTVALQDLSRSGMFLELAEPLAAGTAIEVAIAPEGKRLVTTAIVTHVLGPDDARAVGRTPGNGIAFREPGTPAEELFAIAVDRIVRSARAATPGKQAQIVVADPRPRMLERMSNVLDAAGFAVATAATGMEALAACLRRKPAVLVLDLAMPVYDGFRVIRQLADVLPRLPVLVTSDHAQDVAAAFDAGAADFIAKPFATADVIARVRKLACAPEVRLRGTLGGISLAAVLTMLEQERQTGRLAIGHDGWIDLAEGRVVGAGPATDVGPYATLMALLDRTSGTFELTTRVPEPCGLAMSIHYVLLEHARLRDEASRTRKLTPTRQPGPNGACSAAPS